MRTVKIDIKEFYMSEEPGFLSRTCSELFCDDTLDVQQLLQKRWIGSAKNNLCSRNSCLSLHTES